MKGRPCLASFEGHMKSIFNMDLQFPLICALTGKLASVVWAWNSGSELLP